MTIGNAGDMHGPTGCCTCCVRTNDHQAVDGGGNEESNE